MASNFAALWPTDPKFSVFKDLIFFSTVSKIQEASSILKVSFALSKWPHFHMAYEATVCKQTSAAVVEKWLFLRRKALRQLSMPWEIKIVEGKWRFFSSQLFYGLLSSILNKSKKVKTGFLRFCFSKKNSLDLS